MKQIENYKGVAITFATKENSNDLMVNATEMAKPFGKEIRHWFENQSTAKFIIKLAEYKGIKPIGGIPTSLNTKELTKVYPSLISVVKGGLEQQGTWFNEDIALEFARWLSPEFAIWCNDRIKELLTRGITATDTMIEKILNDPDLGIQLLTQLKEERSKRKEAETTVAILTHTNKTYTATEIAKELGFRSAIEFNNELANRHIQFKQNGTWIPYADYAQQGWFEIKQEVLDNGHIIYHRRITGLGRKAFNKMFQELGEKMKILKINNFQMGGKVPDWKVLIFR